MPFKCSAASLQRGRELVSNFVMRPRSLRSGTIRRHPGVPRCSPKIPVEGALQMTITLRGERPTGVVFHRPGPMPELSTDWPGPMIRVRSTA